MKNIYIPERVEDYVYNFETRALPDVMVRSADFYRRLAGWVMDNKTPILYEQDNDDEYANFSINFNWLLKRNYDTNINGPAETIETMYTIHELTHMTSRLPIKLDEVSANEYAELFKDSEYRASNETEILIHYRIPELRDKIFGGTRIAYDILRDNGFEKPTSYELSLLRPLVVETSYLDSQFTTDEDKIVLNWFKSFTNNREWAAERHETIKPYFSGLDIPEFQGINNVDYEEIIGSYNPVFRQQDYESNMIRNVRLGYAMCGLIVPKVVTFEQAIELANGLEGNHAKIQS